MFRSFYVQGALLFLASGCSNPERLSQREAHQTFDTVSMSASDVVLASRDAVERGRNSGLDVDKKGPNFEIEGSLPGETVQGDISVSGTARGNGNDFEYELALEFDGVEYEGTAVTGEITLLFYAEDVGDLDLKAAVGTSIDGHLDVTGKASGVADIQYDLELRIQGLNIELTAEGDISGHDVSGWDDLTIIF